MRQVTIAILLLLSSLQLYAQLEYNCPPKKLIVAAENLNFRSAPNTSSKPLDKLRNAELLTLIDIHSSKEAVHYSNGWLKVKRDATGEKGYVFGEYVLPQEMAYINYHDASRLQSGNWYGIYEEKGLVKIEKVNPKLLEVEADGDFYSIYSGDDKHKVIISSQEEIKEGAMNANTFVIGDNWIKTGIQRRLVQIGNSRYSLVCTGEVSLVNGRLTKKNEGVYFFKTEINTDEYMQQDLSDCLLQVGEGIYTIYFAGDLNNDGIPELIISEYGTHNEVVYYFRSNEKGELELQSITGIVSKC